MFMTSLKFIDGATLYINGQRVFSKSLLHRFLGSIISVLLEICTSVRGKYTDYIEQNVNNIHILLQLESFGNQNHQIHLLITFAI